MTTVHCHAKCKQAGKEAGACGKSDILIASGGHCVNAELGAGNPVQHNAICDIRTERERQDKKWGEQNHLPQFWTGILGEEYGELCEAVNETVFTTAYPDAARRERGGYENMRKEAIQIAAVALGFIECLERNKTAWFAEAEGAE